MTIPGISFQIQIIFHWSHDLLREAGHFLNVITSLNIEELVWEETVAISSWIFFPAHNLKATRRERFRWFEFNTSKLNNNEKNRRKRNLKLRFTHFAFPSTSANSSNSSSSSPLICGPRSYSVFESPFIWLLCRQSAYPCTMQACRDSQTFVNNQAR